MDHTSNNQRKIVKPHEANNKLAKRNRNETLSHNTNSIFKNNDDLGKLRSTADEAVSGEVTPPPCGGERVKRYRAELGGRRVFIPERWNQEGLLMDWIDYSSFDLLLAPKGIDLARKALIAQAQATKRSSTREKV